MEDRKPCANPECSRTRPAADAHRLCSGCRKPSEARVERPTSCIVCGASFEVRQAGGVRIYCSNRCAQAFRYKPRERQPLASHCEQCGDPLPADRHWRTRYCGRSCAGKANRARNAEAIAAGKRRYREQNPEKHKLWEERRKPAKNAYMKLYYEANKEERKAYQRATRARQRELERQRYAEDSSRKRAQVLRWIKANPEKHNANRNRRRARKANAPTIPFTAAQLDARLAIFGRRCWLCGDEAGAVDHVKPLARGGWHCLANLRPICHSCNSSKGARWPFPVHRGAWAA